MNSDYPPLVLAQPRELHRTPMQVVAYIAAGEGRHVSQADPDDLVPVLNSLHGEAMKKGWKAVRVTGDSMESTYNDGDIVLVEETTEARTKDHVLCSLNGDVQVKEIRISPRTKRTSLLPHNLAFHDPIPVLQTDTLEIIGIVRALAFRAIRNGKST